VTLIEADPSVSTELTSTEEQREQEIHQIASVRALDKPASSASEERRRLVAHPGEDGRDDSDYPDAQHGAIRTFPRTVVDAKDDDGADDG